MTDFAIKWIEELLSGNWSQAFGHLRRQYPLLPGDTASPPCYCATGVACELAVAEGWLLPWTLESGYNGASYGMPRTVRERLGLTVAALDVIEHLNDETHLTLPEIGTYILANQSELFSAHLSI